MINSYKTVNTRTTFEKVIDLYWMICVNSWNTHEAQNTNTQNEN